LRRFLLMLVSTSYYFRANLDLIVWVFSGNVFGGIGQNWQLIWHPNSILSHLEVVYRFSQLIMYQTRYCPRSIYFLSDKYQLSMYRSTLILSLKFGCKAPLTALSRLMVVLYYFFTKFWSYNKSVSYHAYIPSHGKLLLLSWILRLLLITM
jgi:hypothetical protein